MRYALYFTPGPDDALTRAAQTWLGRNAFSGEKISSAVPAGFTAEMFRRITEEPRRYGFHGTLVAPFRLREDHSPQAVTAAAASFARCNAPFVMPGLEIRKLGGFFALVPGKADDISALASAAVDHFNPLRAPLNLAERERRHPERLSARQRDNLDRFGYPYVKDEFRFHMTLTGSLEPALAARVEPALREHFGSLLGRPGDVATVTLFTQPRPGADFAVHSIHDLGPVEVKRFARHA